MSNGNCLKMTTTPYNTCQQTKCWKQTQSATTKTLFKSKYMLDPKITAGRRQKKLKMSHGDSKLFGPLDPNPCCMWGNSNDFPWDFFGAGKNYPTGPWVTGYPIGLKQGYTYFRFDSKLDKPNASVVCNEFKQGT